MHHLAHRMNVEEVFPSDPRGLEHSVLTGQLIVLLSNNHKRYIQ